MVYYRRARTPGGSYFFTLALQDRTSSLLIKHIHSLTT
ncbi:MAG: transposase, partial [Chitinophaga sp.]|nr:transposase [Chitinophaga sp.]